MQALLAGESLRPLVDQDAPLDVSNRAPCRHDIVNRFRPEPEPAGSVNGTKTGGGRLDDSDVARFVASAAGGDRTGWDVLVREFGGLIRAIARAHGLRDAYAADVAQATWLKLLEHLVDVREPGRVGAWLATTARRESLRVLRDATRHRPLEVEALEGESPDVPGEELLVAERDRGLWHAFTRLRPSDQALLDMLLVADPRPSYEEISAALDLRIGSIGPTRARALERLRQQLEDDGTLTLMTA
jgi:RNA polymerase sigma factor (sigma-70 family)